MPKTYNELYIETRKFFREAGIEAHSLEARLIVAHASGKEPSRLMADLQLYTSDEISAKVEAMRDRRLAGEPVAYILGSWEFYGLPMLVSPSVLIPRADTETLVDTALRLLDGKEGKLRILDLCTGSGCIGCALAHSLPGAQVAMLDNSSAALELAKQNIRQCSLGTRAVCLEMDVMEEPPARLGSFDIIVSNPPYIARDEIPTLDISVKDYEPLSALDGGEDGLDFYRFIITHWKKLLRPDCYMVLEIGETQAEQVMDMMLRSGFKGIGCARDGGGHDRVIFGRI